jgi:RHS repeat-associated protein
MICNNRQIFLNLTACNYSYIQLIDFNARFYSPTLGRFIQPDSIVPDLTNSQAWNRYSYVLNSPIKYVDPSGHIPEWECGFSYGGCGTEGKIVTNQNSGSGNGGGNTDQPGGIEEDLEDKEVKIPNCVGPLCLEPEHFYTLFFMPGDDLLPIVWYGINLNYGINLQMEYKMNFDLQSIWYEIQIDENFNAWIGGGQEGAVFTSLIADYESGSRNSYYLGMIEVNDSYYGTKNHSPILLQVMIGPKRDEIRRLTIEITTVIWGNMGVVKIPGNSAKHYYEIPIMVGPNSN